MLSHSTRKMMNMKNMYNNNRNISCADGSAAIVVVVVVTAATEQLFSWASFSSSSYPFGPSQDILHYVFSLSLSLCHDYIEIKAIS